MKTVRILPVAPHAIPSLASLANRIWHECFAEILSVAQIEYMVNRFQSETALREQMQQHGYRYFFLSQGDLPIGYVGVQVDGEKLFLSKLYLGKESRGKGYASSVFSFLEDLCRREQLRAIYLTVNRNNQRAIEVYQRKGFKMIRMQVTPIGSGFVMDDYVFEKSLSKE